MFGKVVNMFCCSVCRQGQGESKFCGCHMLAAVARVAPTNALAPQVYKVGRTAVEQVYQTLSGVGGIKEAVDRYCILDALCWIWDCYQISKLRTIKSRENSFVCGCEKFVTAAP